MDLSTIEHRVDAGYYTNIELFEADINLIKENTLRYFGLRDNTGFFSRASELVDKVLLLSSNFMQQYNLDRFDFLGYSYVSIMAQRLLGSNIPESTGTFIPKSMCRCIEAC